MSEDEGTAALLDNMPVVSAGDEAVAVRRAAPRLQHAVRGQVELRACELESLIAPEHRARSVWQFVQSLDLAYLHKSIRAVEGRPGRAPIDPAILVALWLYATLDGVGSARELARLCDSEDAYRWLCGGVGVNHHALSDLRVEQAAWLDEQLTRSVAALPPQARSAGLRRPCWPSGGRLCFHRSHPSAWTLGRTPALVSRLENDWFTASQSR
jgi:transposase